MNEWPDDQTTRVPTSGVIGVLSAEVPSSAAPPDGTRIRLDYVVDPNDDEPPRVTWWDRDPDGAWVVNGHYRDDRGQSDTVTVMFVSLAAWRGEMFH